MKIMNGQINLIFITKTANQRLLYSVPYSMNTLIKFISGVFNVINISLKILT